MAGIGALVRLGAAGMTGKRAAKGRTTMQALGVGIDGLLERLLCQAVCRV